MVVVSEQLQVVVLVDRNQRWCLTRRRVAGTWGGLMTGDGQVDLRSGLPGGHREGGRAHVHKDWLVGDCAY